MISKTAYGEAMEKEDVKRGRMEKGNNIWEFILNGNN